MSRYQSVLKCLISVNNCSTLVEKDENINVFQLKPGEIGCEICEKTFSSKGNMKKHIVSTHHKFDKKEQFIAFIIYHFKTEKLFSHKKCWSLFREKSAMEMHVEKCTFSSYSKKIMGIDSCEEKNHETQRNSSISSNDKKTDEFSLKTGQIGCEICSKIFNTVKEIEKHTLSDHKTDKSFSCRKCGSLFKENEIMEEHMEKCLFLAYEEGSNAQNVSKSLNNKKIRGNKNKSKSLKTATSNNDEEPVSKFGKAS